MVLSTVTGTELATGSRDFARQLLTIGENRLELLTVEVQEERNHLLHAFLLALGVAGFALLAGIALTAAAVVAWWHWSPLGVLLILSGFHAVTASVLGWWLVSRLRSWRSFPASLDQLQKDGAGLRGFLA